VIELRQEHTGFDAAMRGAPAAPPSPVAQIGQWLAEINQTPATLSAADEPASTYSIENTTNILRGSSAKLAANLPLAMRKCLPEPR
jgi:hypothetical protein